MAGRHFTVQINKLLFIFSRSIFRVMESRKSSAAILDPTFSAPLMLSALSPVKDLKSAYCFGRIICSKPETRHLYCHIIS